MIIIRIFVRVYLHQITIHKPILHHLAQLGPNEQDLVNLTYWYRFSFWHRFLLSWSLLIETHINRAIQRS